ncbi:MAG: hypothetical protein V1837_02415 [Candidatus Woesearchaeota archaeon]
MVSTFRDILIFFDKIGVYDVILPFLLVFTIVFAILEKTKVFGTEEVAGKKQTRKNINAMVAFVISFFVIASSKLVEVITTVSSWMVILLLLSVLFLILIGSFMKEGEGVFLQGGWQTLFMIIMFVGVVAIFLEAIKTDKGEPWLEFVIRFVVENFTSTAVASIVLILVIILFMWFIVHEPKPKAVEKKE